jgi:iron complex transport system substrate-binding protein
VRVISLLPSATDIVARLGFADALVAVSHECDSIAIPAGAPRVTSCAVEAQQTAAAIDAQVRALASGGEALYTLDESRIADLRPDVIVTQQLCEVCAVSETDVRALARRLDPSPVVVTLGGTTIDGIFGDIRLVADALGAPAAAASLISAMSAGMRNIHERLAAAHAPRPRVAVIEWTDPIFAAGHWVPEMVRRAGGIDVLAKPGEHSRTCTMAELRDADPEIVLFAPCGYSVARAEHEAQLVLQTGAWSWCLDRRLWALDGNALTSRPGPNVADGVATMAAIFNPSLFPEASVATARRLGPQLMVAVL